MNRKTKNIIITILIILTIASIGFTMYCTKNHVSTNTSENMMTPPGGMGNPPNKQDADKSYSNIDLNV